MSTTGASSPVPTPLEDRTNVPETSLEAKDREIVHLKTLIEGFTKKKGRGRKRALDTAGDSDAEGGAAKRSKADATPTDYIAYGRTVGRFLGPFVNIGHVVEYGCTADAAMSGDEGEVDEQLAGAWKILWGKFPGFHEHLLSLSNQPVPRRAIIKQLSTGHEGVRSDDTATLKRKIPEWLTKDKAPLVPPLESLKSKAHRGFAHPVFAQLLTPMEWLPDESTWTEILDGTRHIKSDHLPAFLFPLDQEFPVDIEDLEDDAWIMVLDNALKGEVPLRVWVLSVSEMLLTLHQAAKAIFMGPDAALEGDGYHKGRPGNASIIGLSLSLPEPSRGLLRRFISRYRRSKTGTRPRFFWTICGLFDEKEWGNEIIALWNRVVLGTVAVAAPVAAACGPSNLERVKAARARKRAAGAPASSDP
ncbi:hypothetical protein B0H14DRAFT_3130659 [Mycena olivaceomarginata]|nr:hypothetical protein B0H14DRAFT_3130659 [Mycena olivaceomarginata]